MQHYVKCREQCSGERCARPRARPSPSPRESSVGFTRDARRGVPEVALLPSPPPPRRSRPRPSRPLSRRADRVDGGWLASLVYPSCRTFRVYRHRRGSTGVCFGSCGKFAAAFATVTTAELAASVENSVRYHRPRVARRDSARSPAPARRAPRAADTIRCRQLALDAHADTLALAASQEDPSS